MSLEPLPVTEPAVFRALNDLGLLYSRRESPRGIPYAGFRLLDGRGQALSLTLLIEEGVARLTVHRVACTGSAWELLQAAARLPLGALYCAPEDGSTELSLTLRLGNAPLRSELLESLFAYTTGALAALLGGSTPALPRLTRRGPADDAWAKLASLGHKLQPQGTDGAFGMTLDLGHDSHADLTLCSRADGWLEVSACRTPPCSIAGAAGEVVLHRLQRWARCGRFVPAGEGPARLIGAHVAVPDLGEAAESMQWACSQAVAMLQVSQLQLAAAG